MKTEIISILDASGSMQNLSRETVTGYNSFIDKQREQPGECRVSLTLFNSHVTPIYSGAPLAQVTPLLPGDYLCSGYTALYDGIGSTLDREGKRLALQTWADKVVLVVVTDGGENASRWYRQAEVKTMIEHTQRYGWLVLYLAANVDAFQTGTGMGIRGETIAQYAANAVGTQSLYGAASTATASLRSTGAMGQSLTGYMADQLHKALQPGVVVNVNK